MNQRQVTPWGWPTQIPTGVSSWVSDYAPWLLIGAVLVLGYASRKR